MTPEECRRHHPRLWELLWQALPAVGEEGVARAFAVAVEEGLVAAPPPAVIVGAVEEDVQSWEMTEHLPQQTTRDRASSA